MKYVYLGILVFVFLPQNLFAFEAKVAPDVSIDEKYSSDQNLYIASLHTWFGASYEKDITSVSFDQTIQGTIFGDIIALGKKIHISGETFGDIRTLGDTIIVSGVVNKDLIVIGRHVSIDKEAIINGDTLIMAHTVEVFGKLLGESQINSNYITISGDIVGQTTLTGSKISFLNGAKVLSKVSYFSPQKAFIDQNVDIKQELNFNQIESITQNDVIKKIFFAFVSFWAIIKLIATLFVLFILIHLFKIPVQKSIEGIQGKVVQTVGVGLVFLIAIPLLIIILFGSLVLIPVSIIFACIFIIMIMLLPAMSAIILADAYQRYVQKNNKTSLRFNLSALMFILLTFISFVPYIGDSIMYLLYIVSFGAIVRFVYESIRRKKIQF